MAGGNSFCPFPCRSQSYTGICRPNESEIVTCAANVMSHIIKDPENGEWYLSATCPYCECRLVLLHDLNEGRGSIRGVFKVTCPECNQDQTLPAEHYQHRKELHLCGDVDAEGRGQI